MLYRRIQSGYRLATRRALGRLLKILIEHSVIHLENVRQLFLLLEMFLPILILLNTHPEAPLT